MVRDLTQFRDRLYLIVPRFYNIAPSIVVPSVLYWNVLCILTRLYYDTLDIVSLIIMFAFLDGPLFLILYLIKVGRVELVDELSDLPKTNEPFLVNCMHLSAGAYLRVYASISLTGLYAILISYIIFEDTARPKLIVLASFTATSMLVMLVLVIITGMIVDHIGIKRFKSLHGGAE